MGLESARRKLVLPSSNDHFKLILDHIFFFWYVLVVGRSS